MEYVRLCRGLDDYGKLVPAADDIYRYVQDTSIAHFRSIYFYTEEHKKRFEETGSIRGITDVSTPFICWDFDSKTDLMQAQNDTTVLCTRLIELGIPESHLRISFSGNKGFSVELLTTSRFAPKEFRRINRALARGLCTNDKVIFNANRIFRVAGTKHEKSGLYKFPISLGTLASPVSVIKTMAKNMDNLNVEWPQEPVQVSDKFLSFRDEDTSVPIEADESDEVETPPGLLELDYRNKPKGFTNCKFALLNGFFNGGERSNAMIILAASCRALGYPKEIAYGMLKSAARLQAARTGSEPFRKEEIWNNCIQQVYSDGWNGGQYTCKKDDNQLHDLCKSLGPYACKASDANGFITINDLSVLFSEFASKLDENIIRTGIESLDKNLKLTVGMPVAVLGAPSSGKTSLVLDMLSYCSRNDIYCALFEMDMYGPLIFYKCIQRNTGWSTDYIDHVFKHEPMKFAAEMEKVFEEFKTVQFCFKTGLSIQDMKNEIDGFQQKSSKAIKLVAADYAECIQGPYSDTNANMTKIAGDWKDMNIEMAHCGLLLVQPPKSAGDPRDPLYSMRQIKGASMLEQSFRVVLGIYREGFDPQNPGRDKFMTIAALKNTMGSLFALDHLWDGSRQKITQIDAAGQAQLDALRAKIKEEKKEKAREEKDNW